MMTCRMSAFVNGVLPFSRTFAVPTSFNPPTYRFARHVSKRSTWARQMGSGRSDISMCTSAAGSKIGIIGAGGNMGSAIIKGLLTDTSKPTLYTSSRTLSKMMDLPAPHVRTTCNGEVVNDADVIFLCVKPGMIGGICKEIRPILESRRTSPLIISVAAGVTLDTLSEMLPLDTPIVRAMPSLPAAYSLSVTAITGNACAISHIPLAKSTLSTIGDVYQLSESLFSAATGIAGCGVAYVFMMAEAMADAGVKHGLSRKDAMQMAARTIQGAGVMLAQGTHPAVLRNRVESPGGVTVTATAMLERGAFRDTVGRAVEAAVNREREMGK